MFIRLFLYFYFSPIKNPSHLPYDTMVHINNDTAHGCEDQAQVNPPGDGGQADDTPLLKPLPEMDDLDENEDISR